jgi:hypothetical protein
MTKVEEHTISRLLLDESNWFATDLDGKKASKAGEQIISRQLLDEWVVTDLDGKKASIDDIIFEDLRRANFQPIELPDGTMTIFMPRFRFPAYVAPEPPHVSWLVRITARPRRAIARYVIHWDRDWSD